MGKNLSRKIFFTAVIIIFLLGIVAALQNLLARSSAFPNFQNSPNQTEAQTVENSQTPTSSQIFSYATTTISAPNGNITAQIADTPDRQTQGLSGKTSLPQGTGMIFIFNDAGPQYMWMKDMDFPLDIVWLDQNKKVVSISANISPDTYKKNPPKIFYSPTPALYVIELPSGDANRLGIASGLLLSFETAR